MVDSMLHIIARIRSDFPTKFAIPRQSGLVNTTLSAVVFEPEYRNQDAFRGIESYSHLWLVWGFSEFYGKEWSPTVRPPRLGGNKRLGVFATRSPHRPNPLGLSSVKLESVEMDKELGPVLCVSGADLMDGTPIYDVKPYLAYTDAHPDATSESLLQNRELLQVTIPDVLASQIPAELYDSVVAALKQDPRPAYQNDPDRIYKMPVGPIEVHFTVSDGALTVCKIKE